MLRGTLWLLLLMPLRPPGTQGHRGAKSPGQEAEEPAPWPGVQRLQEQLRTVGALSRRYWTLFSCSVWPDHCEDQEPPAPPLGWSLPLWGRRSLDRLAEWFCRFQDCCTRGGDCRISNNLTGWRWRDFQGPGTLGGEGWATVEKRLVEKLTLHPSPSSSERKVGLGAPLHLRRGDRSPRPSEVCSSPRPVQEELRWQMQETRRRCQQSMFIFDEAEKLHPELLELLGPHLEARVPEAQGAEPPRAIFLFLSNLGGSVINEVVLGLLKAGWSREEITMHHLETPLQAEILESADSSFGSSRLVKENLIDLFVPFLPLEYRHVRLCVRDAFLSQDLPYTEAALDEIAKMMTYVPEEERLFSSQGCKSISQRINLFLP
nr:torsin-3A [Peromyscus maniculatus bairdii]